MEMRLFDRDTIAGAVAREIQRREHTPYKQIEGVAYKAAFDRMGSAAEKHIDAFSNDVQAMKSAEIRIICQKCEWSFTRNRLLQGEACPHCFLVL